MGSTPTAGSSLRRFWSRSRESKLLQICSAREADIGVTWAGIVRGSVDPGLSTVLVSSERVSEPSRLFGFGHLHSSLYGKRIGCDDPPAAVQLTARYFDSSRAGRQALSGGL